MMEVIRMIGKLFFAAVIFGAAVLTIVILLMIALLGLIF